jgi:hypothetical protein
MVVADSAADQTMRCHPSTGYDQWGYTVNAARLRVKDLQVKSPPASEGSLDDLMIAVMPALGEVLASPSPGAEESSGDSQHPH